MRASLLFIPTPARGVFETALRRWLVQLGERMVAWGENAHHHRMGSWTQR